MTSITNSVSIDGNIARIAKGIGNTTVYVAFNNEFTVIITFDQLIDDDPFVLAVYQCSSPSDCYEKWCEQIGKMCRKKYNNKYFGNRQISMHLNNGHFDENRKDDIMEFVRMIKK